MNKLDRIITENINKFIINEMTRHNREWVHIGENPYWPYGNRGYLDIYARVDDPTCYIYLPHGRDPETCDSPSIPTYYKKNSKIYDEYINTPYSIPFLGPLKTEEDMKNHKEFMSKLNIQNGQVVIRHNSSNKITNGYLCAGMPKNNYSSNSDSGWYGWASKKQGADPSGGQDYVYILLAEPQDVYDFQNDMERIGGNVAKAMSEKPIVGVYWGDDHDAIAVNSYNKWPIAFIVDTRKGIIYDANWEEVGKGYSISTEEGTFNF